MPSLFYWTRVDARRQHRSIVECMFPTQCSSIATTQPYRLLQPVRISLSICPALSFSHCLSLSLTASLFVSLSISFSRSTNLLFSLFPYMQLCICFYRCLAVCCLPSRLNNLQTSPIIRFRDSFDETNKGLTSDSDNARLG